MPTLECLNPVAEGFRQGSASPRHGSGDAPQSGLPGGELSLEAFGQPMMDQFAEFEIRGHQLTGIGCAVNGLQRAHFPQDFQALADGARAEIKAGLDVGITQGLGTREANPINGREGLRHTEQICGVEKKPHHFLFEGYDLARPTFGSNEGPRQTRHFGARAEL